MSHCPPKLSLEVFECVDGLKVGTIEILAGEQGATGAVGATGPQGAPGLQGASGVQGPSGLSITGATGATGPQGPRGFDGPHGATGPSGAVGPAGYAGATGPSGATGLNGPAGATGSVGATGPQGVQGPSGATGPSPTNAVPFFRLTEITTSGATGAFGPINGWVSGDLPNRYQVSLDGVSQSGNFQLASGNIDFQTQVPNGVSLKIERLEIAIS